MLSHGLFPDDTNMDNCCVINAFCNHCYTREPGTAHYEKSILSVIWTKLHYYLTTLSKKSYSSPFDNCTFPSTRYDLIINAAGNDNLEYLAALKAWKGASYITLSPPLLRNIDETGLAGGLLKVGYPLYIIKDFS